MNVKILGMRVDVTSYPAAQEQIMNWARAGQSGYVCVANVHMTMEAYDQPDFRVMVNAADLVVPDGVPLVWMMRRLGFPQQERVYGPDLTLRILEAAAQEGIPVGFYGSTPQTLERLLENLRRRFPALQVAYRCSPPFRPLTPEEDETVVREINASGTRVLFVGLGCPKQERWMAAHKGRVQAVMMGVGAAFDFLAALKPQAPRWMQRAGLEWLFRLLSEPRRLWRRYFYHNPRFAALALSQLLRERR
jgi:N-acetylglucosaminyldiphosphoundecaprenol N-acetyl-beta-D-mannosaminyltransferase